MAWEIFLLWGSYIGGIMTGLILSILIVHFSKKHPYVVEKVDEKLFPQQKAFVVDISNPVEDLEI